jgi:hypothetical protein
MRSQHALHEELDPSAVDASRASSRAAALLGNASTTVVWPRIARRRYSSYGT